MHAEQTFVSANIVISARRLQWLGYVIIKSQNHLSKKEIDRNPCGKDILEGITKRNAG